jgi:hypothetical protein
MFEVVVSNFGPEKFIFKDLLKIKVFSEAPVPALN